MIELWNKTLELHSNNGSPFESIALEVFKYQYNNNRIYKQFVDLSGYDISGIHRSIDIPFLPISFFKTHQVISDVSSLNADQHLRFESSGTTGSETSKHWVPDPEIYISSFTNTFRRFYGDPRQYIFACLLPSYLERSHASLVYMCEHLIRQSDHPLSGFFLDNRDALNHLLNNRIPDRKVFLIGVTFALLDFAEAYPQELHDTIIMETGGMKGRKEEQTREQVHDFLKMQFGTAHIHSEYGMTELLSQAYSKGDGLFYTPPYMKILLRDINDPKCVQDLGAGLINVIDLANLHSCSFIATDDLGKLYRDQGFEVLGRNDHSALRGCSLLSS